MAQQSGYGIEDIYRGVIGDVITQVREAFLDEGVDIDVLQQLKRTWESKVNASGAVDLEGHGAGISNKGAPQQQTQQAIPPPALRHPPGRQQLQQTTPARPANPTPTPRPTTMQANAASAQNAFLEQQQMAMPSSNSSQMHQSGNSQLTHQQHQRIVTIGKQIPQHNTATTDLGIMQQSQQQALLGFPSNLLGGVNPHIQQSGSSFQLVPGTQYAAAIMDGTGGTPQNLFLLAAAASGQMNSQAMQFVGQPQNVQNAPGTSNMMGNRIVGSSGTISQQQRPTTVAMKTEPGSGGGQHVPQLDGSSTQSSRTKTETELRTKWKNPKEGENIRSRPGTQNITQLDGGRGKAPPGMTDESSEEEDREEEEDPTLSAIKYGLEEDQNEGEAEEEEPLNSGDDQSDDEDLETLFDSDNVVVCQFEKVHRARNKWKFILKDGVMHLRNKDFCFQKSTGEAEW